MHVDTQINIQKHIKKDTYTFIQTNTEKNTSKLTLINTHINILIIKHKPKQSNL